MANTIPPPNYVVGSDNIAPTYNSDGRFKMWGIADIFMGPTTIGKNKHVPKVNDYVVHPQTGSVSIVVAIGPTLIPELESVDFRIGNEYGKDDLLRGIWGRTHGETYRVLYDKSVFPYSLCVDRRLILPALDCQYAVLFKGTDTTDASKIISVVKDVATNSYTDKIPLKIAALDNKDNRALKYIDTCTTSVELTTGELVTAVWYSSAGHVVDYRHLLIEETTFVVDLSKSKKTIVGVSLESPFMSLNQPMTIEFPLNLPASALNLIGVVHYSDGTTARHFPTEYNAGSPMASIFVILGLNQFVSTNIGQEYTINPRYTIQPGENAVNTTVNGEFVIDTYLIKTVDYNYTYSARLYSFPEYDHHIKKYILRHWLYNLERNLAKEATEHVVYHEGPAVIDIGSIGGSNVTIFDGTTSNMQYVQPSLTLNQVSTFYNAYTHTQIDGVVLRDLDPDALGVTNSDPAWNITNVPDRTWLSGNNGQVTEFSPSWAITELSGTPGNITCEINISCGATTLQEWLLATYYDANPLYKANLETEAPGPSHVKIFTDEKVTPGEERFELETTIEVSHFNDNGGKIKVPVVNGKAHRPKNLSNIYLQFFLNDNTPSGDKMLGMACLVVKHI